MNAAALMVQVMTHQQQDAERGMAQSFMEAAISGELTAPAFFAPMSGTPKRYPTLDRVLEEGLEYAGAEKLRALLVAAARGENVQVRAQLLLTIAANEYASQNVGAVL